MIPLDNGMCTAYDRLVLTDPRSLDASWKPFRARAANGYRHGDGEIMATKPTMITDDAHYLGVGPGWLRR